MFDLVLTTCQQSISILETDKKMESPFLIFFRFIHITEKGGLELTVIGSTYIHRQKQSNSQIWQFIVVHSSINLKLVIWCLSNVYSMSRSWRVLSENDGWIILGMKKYKKYKYSWFYADSNLIDYARSKLRIWNIHPYPYILCEPIIYPFTNHLYIILICASQN